MTSDPAGDMPDLSVVGRLRRERDVLAWALAAVAWLDDHAREISASHTGGGSFCQPCTRFAVEIIRGQPAARVQYLRCPEAQHRQRQADDGFALLPNLTGG